MQWYYEVMQRTFSPMVKLNPIERLEAIRRGPPSSTGSSTLWIFIVLGVVIVVGIAAILLIRYIQQLRKELQDFLSRPVQSQLISADSLASMVDGSSPLAAAQEDADSSSAVIKVNPVEIWQGDSLLMRYPQGQAMWQFNAKIMQTKSGQVVIKPLGAVRWGDSRSNRRSSVDIPAQVAAFPFDKDRASARGDLGKYSEEVAHPVIFADYVREAVAAL